ncbi:hypothetical protein B0A49_07536 [Cryomyces minteri]|uniref:Histone acetyltransferase type B catalytic subunit n=1 Tax=Cryomyces minteri TaxID=331657 RepID=A0A4U0WKG1_9PEZI|nr:hypothetical protein B0A49_07536 [Cryomyces minteri]
MEDPASPPVSALAARLEQWSSNANEALTITLLRHGFEESLDSFHPDFTYPIFGEEESIFGYRNLQINLAFAAHNLKPHVRITHDKKWEGVGEVQASDVEGALRPFLPASAFDQELASALRNDASAASFKPPGTILHRYTTQGRLFEIWYSSLADPATKELLRNVQVLVPLFIEGGTAIEVDDLEWTIERWKVYFVYEVDTRPKRAPETSPYALIGYSTSYRVWVLTLPPPLGPSQQAYFTLDPPETDSPDLSSLQSALDLPSRERISQFLVLPPYQSAGHGTHLYNAMFDLFLSNSNTIEITVEDPNEAFDDMRDWCDLARLRAIPDFASLNINTTIPPGDMKMDATIPVDRIVDITLRDKLRTRTKIQPRQFSRLVEMHLLSTIPPLHRNKHRITRKEKSATEGDRKYYLWRLYVKHRLAIMNRDQLMQLDREERIEKLDATVDSVEEDYLRLLEVAEKRQRSAKQRVNAAAHHKEDDLAAGAKSKSVNGSVGKLRGKRHRIVLSEEDDDEAEEVVEEDDEATLPTKKRRVA